jgi:predicted MFS family arabinose efflux permease
MLANWQWLFLIEGIPSIIMGILTLLIVKDTPVEAHWLTPDEKQIVLDDLEKDRLQAGQRKHGFAEALRMPQVWLLTVIYFCVVSANPTFGFWVPTIINGLGVSNNTTIGLLSAVPYVVSILGVLWVGRHSDRTLERRYHCALSCLAAAAGLVLIGVFDHSPFLGFAALVVGVSGVLCAFAPFWQIPTMLLAGTAAAGAIALINSIGNLSGWLAPFAVGWLKEATGKTSSGLYVVAGLEALGAALILLFMPRTVCNVGAGFTPARAAIAAGLSPKPPVTRNSN